MAKTDRNPFQMPLHNPYLEQLDLKSLVDTVISQNSRFDTNKFEVRISIGEFGVHNKHLWQIINNNVQFSYKEFNYDLTAIYENHGHINYDKYDKQLSSRLPMFGSRQGDIRFEKSNLKMTDRSDSAKKIHSATKEQNHGGRSMG